MEGSSSSAKIVYITIALITTIVIAIILIAVLIICIKKNLKATGRSTFAKRASRISNSPVDC